MSETRIVDFRSASSWCSWFALTSGWSAELSDARKECCACSLGQSAALPGEIEPAGQTVCGEAYGTSHGLQRDAPSTEEEVPCGQSAQPSQPARPRAAEAVPRGHGSHDALPGETER